MAKGSNVVRGRKLATSLGILGFGAAVRLVVRTLKRVNEIQERDK